MTVREAVDRATLLYPTAENSEAAVIWIKELEERIKREIFGERDPVVDPESLSAPGAYSDIYPLYVIMKTDLCNSDAERYRISSSCFCSAYAEYANYCVRTGSFGIGSFGTTYLKTV